MVVVDAIQEGPLEFMKGRKNSTEPFTEPSVIDVIGR